MATQNIVEKILSDAQMEADGILSNAQKKGQDLISKAQVVALEKKLTTKTTAEEYAKSTMEKRLADARLESSKILLREKRKAVEVIYELALQRLLALEKEDCLALYTALLEKYAEEGDEVVLSDKFLYVAELSTLPVVSKRNLKISETKLNINGGMKLLGKLADKDLSFTALLTADKDNNQAELARKLFQ